MRDRATFGWVAAAVVGVAGLTANVRGQEQAPPPAPGPQPARVTEIPLNPKPDEDRPTFSQEELDQMLAPIALYPDTLLDQVLMASTYPVEVVQADRWVKANPGLKDEELAKALEDQPWDPSVKSLVNSPTVLGMLSEKLDWTARLGDAFIAQQQQVMDTIQRLRDKAHRQGNLKDTPEQKIIVEERDAPGKIIVIEPASPEVIYVPVYDPGVVYGPWWYPAYPPAYYYPPAYPPHYSGIWFGLSFHCGPPWGYAWGHSDWHHRRIIVDVNRNINHNHWIDRARYRDRLERRDDRFNVGKDEWVHDPRHRRGVWYRDTATARRFNSVSLDEARKGREIYRGRISGAGAGNADARPRTSAVADDRFVPINPPDRTDRTDRAVKEDRRDRNDRSGDVSSRYREITNRSRSEAKGDAVPTPTPAADRDAVRESIRDASARRSKVDDSGSGNADKVREIGPIPTSPRARGDALRDIDRDAAVIRSDSQRGAASRSPTVVRREAAPAPAPRPAPSSSSPPPRASRSSDSGGSSSSSSRSGNSSSSNSNSNSPGPRGGGADHGAPRR